MTRHLKTCKVNCLEPIVFLLWMIGVLLVAFVVKGTGIYRE